ncbi:hypothetical protein Drose_35945 [Dactylosporangium roseum]|uniref:Uncharacterized protein n=1 Tax=Dactylosporangium roseum TaxID=47989 RepID=A0ABY5Z2Y1_9ACTN|nr:hypothetical protein [Dactylosporangium roseum]UWZ36370.1 hypothetical protein Drose_35945 [Dactylosporangium roseum]
MPIFLKNLPPADRDQDLRVFLQLEAIADLRWPDDVVRQWLYDHGEHLEFLRDYEDLDLARIRWNLEDVPVAELKSIPTGPSDQEWLEEVAADHVYWLSKRPQRIQDAWENEGTWLVPPIMISRDLLHPESRGLQVIEGRMRTGILQGRRSGDLHVADSHQAWVGRSR